MQYKYCLVFFLLSLFGCSSPEEKVPTFSVTANSFSIKVEADGEIEAAKAQRILSPGNQPMSILWLAQENTMVEKGEVIARFDAQQIMRDSRNEELEMMKIETDIVRNSAIQQQQQNDIESDQVFVQEEFEFVDRFAIDDLRIYSQLEIIDTLQNRNFLEAKDKFLDWKEGSIEEQHQSEIDVLSIRQDGHKAKFDRFKSALSQLEVIAPYSGLLVYEKDRRGEKPSIGQTVFPGRPIANIPNLDDLRAKLYVLANDAIGLTTQLPVVMHLDAFPERKFTGKITNVSGFPRSIERGSPVTYYEVEVALDNQDNNIMQPGRKLSATIIVQDQQTKISVPIQAIHNKEGRNYVYTKSLTGFTKQYIETGIKNQFLVEVTEGIAEGDIIALSDIE